MSSAVQFQTGLKATIPSILWTNPPCRARCPAVRPPGGRGLAAAGAVGGDAGGECLEQHDAAAAGLLGADPPELAVTVTLVCVPGRLGDEHLVHGGVPRGGVGW